MTVNYEADCGCVIAIAVSVQGEGCCEMCYSEEASVDEVRVVSHCVTHSSTT